MIIKRITAEKSHRARQHCSTVRLELKTSATRVHSDWLLQSQKMTLTASRSVQ